MKAFITGSSRGIGFAIAKELALAGYDLFITSKTKKNIEKAAQILKGLNKKINVETIVADLKNVSESSQVISEWLQTKTDSIDILVLNAGIFIEGDITSFSSENYDENMDVNFNANYKLLQQIIPFVKKSKIKRIVLIGSTAAYEPYPLVPTYGIVKYALRGLAINLRIELMKDNVGVTFISPGGTKTDMWEGEELPEDRLLDPSDIGKIVSLIPKLSRQAVIDELIVRPMLGDIHE